jgi:hypothetical protein
VQSSIPPRRQPDAAVARRARGLANARSRARRAAYLASRRSIAPRPVPRVPQATEVARPHDETGRRAAEAAQPIRPVGPRSAPQGDDRQIVSSGSALRGLRSPTAPPGGEPSGAHARGPQALATVIDSLERQLDHAETVDDRIRLLKAYTGAAVKLTVVVVLPLLVVAGLVAFLATRLSPGTLVTALAVGTLAGGSTTVLRFWLSRAQSQQATQTEAIGSQSSEQHSPGDPAPGVSDSDAQPDQSGQSQG